MELDSPNFKPPQLEALKARDYKRINRPPADETPQPARTGCGDCDDGLFRSKRTVFGEVGWWHDNLMGAPLQFRKCKRSAHESEPGSPLDSGSDGEAQDR